LAHRIPVKKTLLIRNGVDIQMFKPDGIPQNGTFTVCYAGSFYVWQGMDILVEAGRMLRDMDIKLKFIGFRQTQQDREWKERIRKTLGPQAELVDRVSQGELTGLLQAADLLVLPRPYHPATVVAMPTKFAEYIALGKPVLVTDVDETAQFVRKYECGLVCHPSASGLAEAIRQARSMGRPKLRIMGERGRRLAETTFSWEVISQEYYDFLTSIKSSSIQSIQ
jgi:glycosyltransferase involved in cell wall biosynthesis